MSSIEKNQNLKLSNIRLSKDDLLSIFGSLKMLRLSGAKESFCDEIESILVTQIGEVNKFE